MKKQTILKETEALFKEIQSAFPNLRMTFDTTVPYLDINVDIPKQPGLVFKVNLNLQSDELYLSAGQHFWLGWFPCTDEAVVQRFREAVLGVLSGKYRILEYYRGNRLAKAELQMPDGDGWKTIGIDGRLILPFPMRMTIKEIRNAEHPSP